MTIDQLAHNFCELYAAIERSDCNDFLLAASGGILYQSDSASGLLYGLFGTDEDIRATVQKTAQLFQKLKKEWLQPHLGNYQQFLTNQCLGLQAKETDIHPVRTALQRWEQSTFPFLHLMQQPKGRAQQFLQKFFHDNPFKCPEWDLWCRYQTIIKFECFSCGPLPMHDFMVLSHSEQKPSDAFDSWIRRVKEVGSLHDQGSFHRGLTACVEHCAMALPHSSFSTVQLETALWNLGHKDIFLQPDPEQISWRNQFSAGDRLGGYTLQRKLGGKLYEMDSRWVFEVKERDDIVIVIPQNRSVLHMRNFILKSKPQSPLIGYQEIDPEGRFALAKKLIDPAEGVGWAKIEELSEEDKRQLNVRVRLTQMFLQLSVTPIIELTHFRIDEEGKLRSIKSCEAEDFNFNHIEEDLIFGTSQGNPVVYAYLVKESQINRHPYFKFYGEVVRNASNNTHQNVSAFGAAQQIGDGTIIKRAETLYNAVAQIREEACSAAERAGTVMNRSNLQKLIEATIRQHYDASLGVGRILPHVKAAVIASVKLQSHDSLPV